MRGGFNMYKGLPYQRGYGLGGTFRKFFSWIVPIISKHAFPVIKEAGKAVGHSALTAAADIAKDTLSGKDFKESAQNRVNTAIDSLKEKTEEKLKGMGIKRRKKSKKYTVIRKKQKIDDIFN